MSKEDQANCVFCKILSGEYPISEVHSDDLCVGLMTIEPVNTGHAMVIPRGHFPYLADVPAETAGHMLKVSQKIAAAIRASDLPCDGINLFVADGEAAHQSVFHSHFHIYPRLKDDGFGFKYDERHFQRPPRDELNKTAELIRTHIQLKK
jgi:histidine triad (HIT) family protein